MVIWTESNFFKMSPFEMKCHLKKKMSVMKPVMKLLWQFEFLSFASHVFKDEINSTPTSPVMSVNSQMLNTNSLSLR